MFSANFNNADHEYAEQKDLIVTLLEQTGLTVRQSYAMYRNGRKAIDQYLKLGTFAYSEWLKELCNLEK